MRISLLGPLTVDGAPDGLPPRDRVVLSALALRAGEVVDAEQLADALWADDPPASAAKVVQGCISRLRRLLGPSAIQTVGHGYQLRLAGDDVDTVRFDHMVDRARELLALGQHERAVTLAGRALELWRGRPLGDLPDWGPARIEAARLHERRLEAEELRVEAALAAGMAHEYLGSCRSLAEAEPLRERRWAMLATALYQTGRQGEALRALQAARSTLATELGVDPGPELAGVEQAILQQDETLLVDLIGHDVSDTCPYPGLVSFDVEDAEAFFGRSADIDACVRTLQRESTLVIAGASGSGKSSLTRAGLLPALRVSGEAVEIVTLGNRPSRTLEHAVETGVLVIDQLEEAMAACRDAGSRTALLDAIAARLEIQRVVLVVRADRLGELSSHPTLARRLERSLHLLGPMGDAGLREAILKPAENAGLLVEPGLADILVRDVQNEPGALPLLSHALRQTWERRDGRTLTVDGYRATGGIQGAIAQTAEAVYSGSNDSEQRALRDLLLRMATSTTDGSYVRAAVPNHVATADREREVMVERLVEARLVTVSGDTLELAHEAVIRAWPRLRSWLDDDVEGQRILRHLTMTAETWEATGRPTSELYRGARLARALEWRGEAEPTLTRTEEEFLDAAAEHAALEREESLRRADEQARSNRRLRRALTVVAIALLLALAAGAFAFDQARRADDEAAAAARSAATAVEAATAADAATAAAQEAAIAAEARRLGATALTVRDIDHALLLAVEGVRLENSNDTTANLLGVLSRAPELVGSVMLSEPLLTVDVGSDGRFVAVGGPFTGVTVMDASTLETVATIDEPARDLEFSPDATRLAVLANEYTPLPTAPAPDPLPLAVHETTTFAPVEVQPGGQPAGTVAFDASWSGDGTRLSAIFLDLVSAAGPRLLTWDLADPTTPIADLEVVGGEPIKLVSDHDGTTLHVNAFTPRGWELQAYDLSTGDIVRSLALGGEALAISRDGRRLATMSDDEVVVVAAGSYEELFRFRRDPFPVSALAFTSDGSRLAASSRGESAVVWDLDTGTEIEHLDGGHAGDIWDLGFSADDERLFTVALDRHLLAWDIAGSHRYLARILDTAGDFPVDDFTLSTDGTQAAWVGGSRFRVVDMGTGQLTEPVSSKGGTIEVATWSDGSLLTTGGDGVVRRWEATGELIAERHVTDAVIVGLEVSADGRLVVGGRDGIVHVLDAGTLDPAGEPIAIGDRIMTSAVTPDGTTVVALTWGEQAIVADASTGARVAATDLGFVPVVADVSPDGTRLAVGGAGGEVGLIELASGEWIRNAAVGHRGGARSLSFSADGTLFTSGGDDGRVVVWDGRSGEHLSTVQPGSPIESTRPFILPDSRTIVVGSTAGVIYRWGTSSDELIEAACRIVTRELSADEWRDARGDEPHRPTCS